MCAQAGCWHDGAFHEVAIRTPAPLLLTVVLVGCPSEDDAPEDTDVVDTAPEVPDAPAPTLESVLLEPDDARRGETLTCLGVPSGITDRVTYAWTAAGEPVADHTSDTLAAGWLVHGDVVRCTVTPWAGDIPGEPRSAEVTLANTRPTAPTVRLEPATPAANRDLVCVVDTPAEDADEEPLTYRFVFTEAGGARVPGVVIDGTRGALPHAELTEGDVWTCAGRATDGTDEGPPGRATVTVGCPLETVYQDADGDGFGNPAASLDVCVGEAPPGSSSDGTDCDDAPGTGAGTFPGAPETVGAGLDQDCDGVVSCYVDQDRDGWTTSTLTTTTLTPGARPGCPTSLGLGPEPEGDCDDTEPSIHPGQVDRCDGGIDDDCDPSTDDAAFTNTRRPSSVGSDLQAILDVAGNGDVISVCPGAHETSASVVGTLEIVGDPAGPSSLVGDGTGSVLTVAPGAVLTLRDLAITGGGGEHGGGVRVLAGGFAVLEDMLLEGNHVSGDGGAIHVDGTDAVGAPLRFIGTTELRANSAARGGGLALLGDATVGLADLIFEDNVASGDGGGLWALGAPTLSATSSLWIGNTAGGDGGGVFLDGAASFQLVDSELEDNAAGGDGGGLALVDATLRGGNLALVENTATGGAGGGIHCDGCRILTPNTANDLGIVRDNRAARGGGLALTGSACAVLVGDAGALQGRLESNQATEAGGGVHLEAPAELRADDLVITWPGGPGNNLVQGQPGDVAATPGDLVWNATPDGLLHGRWWWDGATWQLDAQPGSCP